MNNDTIFRQLCAFIPEYELTKLVKKYNTDKYSKTFTTKHLLLCLLYAQASGIDSIRAIETGLNALSSYHYHLGLPKTGIKRSTFADANNRIDYEVFEKLFYSLLDKYQSGIFKRDLGINHPLYSLDASLIDLVVDMFPWAKFRATKGAIKMHTVINVEQQLPVLLNLTEGRIHDLDGMPHLSKEKFSDSIVTFDKGYWRSYWLYRLHKDGIYFVTRIKENVNYEVTGQHKITLGTGILKDESIRFTSKQLKQDYPEELRLVTYYDSEHEVTYRFVTNITHLKAETIALIYKYRWEVETFFRWIKQNLKIKSFLGCSKNAVFNQIWVAMIYYLILSHIKSQGKYEYGMLELSRVVSVLLFQNMPLLNLLSADFKSTKHFKDENLDQFSFDTS